MKKLPVVKIIYGAFVLPLYGISEFSRALAIPTLILVCAWAAWLFIEPPGLLLNLVFNLVYIAAFSFFAITCHRLILVGDKTLYTISAFNFKRFFWFFGWLIVVISLCAILELLIINIYVNTFSKPELTEITEEAINKQMESMDHGVNIAKYIAYIPVMYIFGRFSLVFPATAIDMKTSLKWSWMVTRRNGIRIFFIVGIFPWLMEALLSLVERDNATIIEQTIIGFLVFICWAIGVFALSLSYIELQSVEK